MEIKLNGVDDVLAKLHPKAYKQALNRTINDIGSKMKTYTTKEVRRTYNIKSNDIKRYMKVRRSRYSDMTYQIDIRSSPFNAMRFGAKLLKKNGHVSVKIRKDNGRKVLKRAFKAKSGAILQREKGTQNINAVTTVSIPQMFNKKILKEADDIAQKEMSSKFKDNFSFYIGKA